MFYFGNDDFKDFWAGSQLWSSGYVNRFQRLSGEPSALLVRLCVCVLLSPSSDAPVPGMPLCSR